MKLSGVTCRGVRWWLGGPVLPDLWTVAQWETLFLGRWNGSEHTEALSDSNSANSWYYYGLAYPLDGAVAMFEATGNTDYLDRALLYTENAIGDAVLSSTLVNSQFKDSYLAWGAWNHPTDPSINGGEYPLYESYMFRYVCRMLRALKANPAVYANPTYLGKYNTILAFIEQHIYNKWNARGANSYIYRSHVHMASHWAYITLILWKLTGNTAYKTVLDNINLHLPNYSSSLRQQVITNPVNSAANFWASPWGSFAQPGSDVSHGNNFLAFVVEDKDYGNEWNATDIQKFLVLFNQVVWPAPTTYRYYVDGTGVDAGWWPDGFIKLARYDTSGDTQMRLQSHTVGLGMQYYGNCAYNAKRLLSS